MRIGKLFELNELAKEGVKKYEKKRFLYEIVKKDKGKHFTGIVGSRGVGKTVILRQLACKLENSFYVSLDSDEDIDLFELAKILIERYRIKTLLIDEIHFLSGYEGILKRIFDFLDIKVVFTSSVSLSLFESMYDFSRRIKLYTIFPFSFREYIYFLKGDVLPALSVREIVTNSNFSGYLKYEYLFEFYIKGGLYPFSLEEPDALSVLSSILNKVINRDIPSLKNIRFDEVQKIEKVVRYIGKSEVDSMNYTNISRNVGITKYKAEQYINLLKRALVLNPVEPVGTNVLKEPKILMYLPFRLLFKTYDESIGALREDFVTEALQMAGCATYYLKSRRGEKTPDYFIDDGTGEIVIEVGGKGKGREQFKGFKAKDKIIFSQGSEINSGLYQNKYPLFLAGFLS